MAVATVTFDGTRVNAADATTNFTAAGGTPTAETDYFYQGTASISAAVKTSEGGFYYRQSGVTHDFTTPKVWLAKGIATNKDALDGNGFIFEMGTGLRAAYYQYFVYTAATYPFAGGWQIIPIDPNIASYRSASLGTPTLSALDFFGIRADFSATSKAPNLGLDAIDYITAGTGLTLVGGDGADADGTFTNFVTTDETTTANRWGVVSTRGGVLYVNGTLQIGTATATVFTDLNRVVVFNDGRFGTGFAGIKFNLASATTNVAISSTVLRGLGTQGTNDTRPDYTVTNTSGTMSLTGCSVNTFRNITLTSAVTVSGCSFINGLLITQASAAITECSFSGQTTATGVALLTSNNPTAISNCTFNGASTVGHAIMFTTPGTYTFTNNSFLNYGADGTNNAAVYNNSGGLVTLNVIGSAPTIRNGAGATTTIPPSLVPLDLIVKNAAGSPIQNARVAMYVSATDALIFNTLTDVNGEIADSYSYTTDVPIYIRVRKSASGTTRYVNNDSSGTITSTGFSATITLLTDVIVAT